jgi:hypothetical protein
MNVFFVSQTEVRDTKRGPLSIKAILDVKSSKIAFILRGPSIYLQLKFQRRFMQKRVKSGK